MKKALVTGANSFVGSAVCKELLKAGIEVIGIVRNCNSDLSRLKSLNGIRIEYCEMSEYYKLPDIVLDRDIDVIYHFAWDGSVGSYRGNIDIQLNNIKNTCELIKACSILKCKRFIFASSIMEYEIRVLSENNKVPRINALYASAKSAANNMARIISASFEIEYISGLISNIYGPGETNQRLINSSLHKLLNGEQCEFSPGEQLYDFIYITDAAKAFVAIGFSGINNKTYYIGSANPKPLKQYIIQMCEHVDPKIKPGLGALPFNGVSLTYKEFDVNALAVDTGFKSEISFSEGIDRTIDFIRDEHSSNVAKNGFD